MGILWSDVKDLGFVGLRFASWSRRLLHRTMHNETPVRQGEFGRRSIFLAFGVDAHTNQESGCSCTFLHVLASSSPRRRYHIETDYVVGMTTSCPERRGTASKRALEALEASQTLPTPQFTAVRKYQRVYRDPINNDDLSRYTLTQVEAMQQQSIQLLSSTLLSPAPQSLLIIVPPMPPMLRSLTQGLERE